MAGGGGHHAYPDHGEGFCLLNDIAVGIKKMQKEGRVRKAAVVDLDAHQGNGTAAVFRDSPEIFTFSMHNSEAYPEIKEKSSLDIPLRPETGDEDYLGLLSEHLPSALEKHAPGLVVYVAGADCHETDLLGGLAMTFEGLKKRDEFVFSQCFKMKIPVAVVLAGGYLKNPADTVAVHAQTIETALVVFGVRPA
ncbi:MAG: histone deacetylase [bacterium]